MGSSKGANGDNQGGRGGSGRSMKVNQDDPGKSDQIRPNQTKSDQKKRTSLDQGAGRWIKTGADELDLGRARWIGGGCDATNGKAKGLNDGNTCFICYSGQRGSGRCARPRRTAEAHMRS